MWLRAGRAQKNMSLDDVAKVTKIQARILERLEAGKFDGLPAEVFVRGFVRSFAKAVGLDEEEALRRYTACAKAEAPPSAKAFVETMSDLAPNAASGILGNKTIADTVGFRATPIVMPSGSGQISLAEISQPPTVTFQGEISSAMMATGTVATAAIANDRDVVEVSLMASAPTSSMVPEDVSSSSSSASSMPAVAEDVEVVMLPEAGLVEPSPIQAIAEALVPQKKKRKPSTRKTGSHAVVADPTAEPSAPVVAAAKPKRKRRTTLANGTPAEASPVVTSDGVVELCETPSDLSGPIASVAMSVSFEAVPAVASHVEPTTVPAVEPMVEPVAPPTISNPTARLEALLADGARIQLGEAQLPASEPTTTTTMTTTTTTEVAEIAPSSEIAPSEPTVDLVEASTATSGTWSPKMPTTTSIAPWRMSRGVTATTLSPVVASPSITIDDADPDSAERLLEDRKQEQARRPRARSFLPPILLDRDDRAGRQGGLTLAVIILLIAATLTLSYLMRRPSSRGDGVTTRDVPTLNTLA